MKALFQTLSLLVFLASFFAPTAARAQDDSGDDQDVSFQTFYDQLGSQGSWIQTDDYGYVWQPPVTDPDWRPYSEGHWVYTDDGWTWDSDESWGWATYHYGRWANIDGCGWVWVPGYRWAPAWVSWRYGGGYCGWAPLPPETIVGAEYGDSGVDVGIGFHFGGDVDVNFGIGAGCYNFVSVGDLGERHYRGHYLDRNRNYVVINQTTNITNIVVNNNYGTAAGAGQAGHFRGIAAGGPPINEVNAHSRQHIETAHLTASNQVGPSTLQGNSLAVYAPRVNAASVHESHPTTVAQTLSHPTFNRGDSVTKPMAVTASIIPPPPSAEAIHAAQVAQRNAPAHAKIAKEGAPVKAPLAKPLTSLAPIAPSQHFAPPAPGANTVNPNVEHPVYNNNGGPVHTPPLSTPNEPGTVPQHTYTPQASPPAENQVRPTPVFHPENTPPVPHTVVAPPQHEITPPPHEVVQPEREAAPPQRETYQPPHEVTPPPHEVVQPQHEEAPPQRETVAPQHEAAPPPPAFHPAPPPPPTQQVSRPSPAPQQGGQSGGSTDKKKYPGQ